ncbi:MAG: signal peptide peptidase SppA [Bacteroidota bacterium]
MKQFFKFTFASCLGTFLAMICLVFFGSFIFAAIGSAFGGNKAVKEIGSNGVLHLTFTDAIPELKNNVDAGNSYNFDTDEKIGLHDVVAAIEKAKDDDNIKGIFLDPKGSVSGLASSTLVRNAIMEFKESDKFIISYADFYGQSSYYLASTADQIILNPVGNVDFRGFAASGMFFKDFLDKVGVEFQVFYAGQFKSASEPYRRNNMSPQNKLQTREYLTDMWEIYLDGVSEARGLSKAELKSIASEFKSRNANGALESRMIDEIGYRSKAYDLIREKLEIEDKSKKINFVKLSDYAAAHPRSKGSGSNKIAVVYAEGVLVDNGKEAGAIDGEQYEKLLRKIREENKVKALVLRVNSPGGSVLASSKILQELKLIQDQGIPVVASYGDLAASGGYYISCHADSIFAEENTITGSIGVYAMVPNATELLDKKLGIHYDSVKTHKFAGSFNTVSNWSEEEKKIFQDMTDDNYKLFLSIVAEGRDMTVDEVHKIAQGRVWSGKRAVDNGLVDEIGGLQDAIDCAAGLADISEYRVREYPSRQDPITQMLNRFLKTDEVKQAILKEHLGEFSEVYNYYQLIKGMDKPIALMPIEYQIQ